MRIEVCRTLVTTPKPDVTNELRQGGKVNLSCGVREVSDSGRAMRPGPAIIVSPQAALQHFRTKRHLFPEQTGSDVHHPPLPLVGF